MGAASDHANEIGVFKLRERPTLANESLAEYWIALQFLVEELDRAMNADAAIEGAVHHAVTTEPDYFEDSVVKELLVDQG